MSMTGELLRVSPAKLKSILDAPDSLIYGWFDEALQDNCFSVEKTWNAIEFMLDMLHEDGVIPRILPFESESPVGVDFHYGPVTYHSPEDVGAIAGHLARIDEKLLKTVYRPEQMTELGVYPDIWDRADEREENFEYVWSYFKALSEF